MANVVRFVLSSARTFEVSGAGVFINGVLDIDANDLRQVARTRWLVQPYQAVELGILDEATPPPTLPAVPGPPAPDPYSQYLLPAELLDPDTGKLLDSKVPDRLSDVSLKAALGSPELAALNARGQADAASSQAIARMDYDDAAAFTEEFANLTGWSSEGLQVSGGKVYSAAAGPNGAYGAKKALAGLASGRSRIIGTFEVSASGSPALGTYIGINKSGNELTTPAGLITSGSGSLMIGVATSNGPATVNNGATTFAPAPAPAALTPGVYEVMLTIDDTYITLTASNADASIVYSVSVTRASYGTPTHVTFWIYDARALTGNSVRGIAARTAANTLPSSKPRSSRENNPHWIYNHTLPGGRPATFALPPSYDSRAPLPLVIYTHGSGESYNAVTKLTGATLGPIVNTLLTDGYAVISSDNGGLENWGNQTAVDAVLDQYRWVRGRFPLGPVVFLSVSMGSLVAGNVLARRTVPNIVGWYGIDPVLSLAAAHAMPAHQAKIRTAYGIASDGSDYASKTSGFDPMLRGASEFRGIPVRMVASPDDITVLKAEHADPFLAKLNGVAAEASLLAKTGAHVAAGHYDLADLRSFLSRVTAS